jgi:lipopolysaccharide transport system ATP-binding protein
MYSDEPAIKVNDLSKCYTIYRKPADRLKQSVISRVFQFLGQPLRTYYREFWALRNITLEVNKGETLGVIGRNGSGKSTLLQLVCGTLTPTAGTIETKGRITALLELGSGFNPAFTGRENIYLNGAILGLSQAEIEDRFEAIAAFADIGEFIEQPVKIYSSGMKVRLAFAVQAMVDPDILIVDEALAVGDERFQRKCIRRLEELKENGTSILFVSHSVQQIIELCDRALLLEQGQRLLIGNPVIVARAYQRLIFAKREDQSQIVKELKELDKTGGVRENALPAHPPEEGLQSQPNTDEKFSAKDFFESGMIPQSTEVYPIQGARLDSIRIFNAEWQEVNNLLAGREYYFEIRGTFLEERQSVFIGFNIRTKTNVVVTGHHYPSSNQYISNVKRGQKFRLTHKLKMDLISATYFAGAGIWSTTEPACMHRIIDAIMFQVLPKAKPRALGYVDLATQEPEFEIIENRDE